MIWEVLDTGCRLASENMQIDADLLASIDTRAAPLIHFYEWKGDSATYGHFVDPACFLDMDKVKEKSLHLAKRSTGGGIIFHLWDMAFSVLIPSSFPQFSKNTLENYALVNNAVLAAVGAFLTDLSDSDLSLIEHDFQARDSHCERFCMAKPTKYDLIWKGKKVAGASQRQTKGGLLHQGTISLIMPPEEYLRSVLLPGTEVWEAMKTFTLPLLGESATAVEIAKAKQFLREQLIIQLNLTSCKV